MWCCCLLISHLFINYNAEQQLLPKSPRSTKHSTHWINDLNDNTFPEPRKITINGKQIEMKWCSMWSLYYFVFLINIIYILFYYFRDMFYFSPSSIFSLQWLWSLLWKFWPSLSLGRKLCSQKVCVYSIAVRSLHICCS